MRCACVDIGSNTTALLVADVIDGAIEPVGFRREFTLIGAACGPHGIAPEKLFEVEEVVATFVDYAEYLHADRVTVIATHVVRDAANGGVLARMIESRTKHPVRVLSGPDEARLSYTGAVAGKSFTGTVCVIDAGGGSTEITWRDVDGELRAHSFPVGSSSLRETCMPSDPPTAQEIANARVRVEAALSELDPPGCAIALAVGGGATTASEIVGGVIDAASVDRVIALACTHSSEELATTLEIEYDRARLLPASLVVLGAVSARLKMPLQVGRGGVREGALLELAGAPPS